MKRKRLMKKVRRGEGEKERTLTVTPNFVTWRR